MLLLLMTLLSKHSFKMVIFCSGYNFFGMDSSLSKFEFVCQNRENYKNAFCAELNKCLKDFDYYTFINKFSEFFKVYRKDNKIEFVTYNIEG